MAKSQITSSSTAEYFSKNLQQVGFSSLTKAVLTTLKEAIDNALDACEDNSILPEVHVYIEKLGSGSIKNSDQVKIRVEDNGPGIDPDNVPKVFGEYLASSKFGRGRCSRGQQGIGISAATTWAQLTNASGARVITKTKDMRKALSALVEVDIRNNRGVIKEKETIEWGRKHGTSVEFVIDGRIQLNGEGGLNTYLTSTALLNPHLTLHYCVPGEEAVTIVRVSEIIPEIPEPTLPHPHTMKLGEFIAYSHNYGKTKVDAWLKKGFSRVHEGVLKEMKDAGIKKALLDRATDSLKEDEFKQLFTVIQSLKLMAPSTKSVLAIGEEALSKSITRLGKIDFFSVVTRKPTICDFKPVQIEVAIARVLDSAMDNDSPVQVLRFANRVPLQFDKSGCAIVHAIESVNWRSYGLGQPKDGLPQGPYIVAVSVVSPFIKFKNASKETIDGSEELIAEIRLTLIQAGQRLSRHIKHEKKAAELEEKLQHIEQFGPILVDGIARIVSAPDSRKKKAIEGLRKLLGRDANATESELKQAQDLLEAEHVRTGAKEATDMDSKEAPVKNTKKAKGKGKGAKGKSLDEDPVQEELEFNV